MKINERSTRVEPDLDIPPAIHWETYLERLREEATDDAPDTPAREAEFHSALDLR